MPTDPQGYPVVAYERISDNHVVFQVLSDGTIIMSTGTIITAGQGSPEGVVTAPPGSLYTQTNATPPNFLWQKQTGSGNTGWALLSSGGGGGTPGGANGELQFNNSGAFGGTSGVTWDAASGIQMDPVATPMSAGVNVLIDGLDTPPVTMVAGLFAAALDRNTGFISNTDLIGLDGEASCGGNGFEVDVQNFIGVKSLVNAGANAVIDTMTSFEAVAGAQPGSAINNYIGLHIPDPASLGALVSARAIQVDGGISQFDTVRISAGHIDASGHPLTILGPTNQTLTLDTNQIDLMDVPGNGLSVDSTINNIFIGSAAGARLTFTTVNAFTKDVDIKDPATTAAAGHIRIGATHATTVGAAGGASALPATPLGYLIINVEGTQVKIPYYNT